MTPIEARKAAFQYERSTPQATPSQAFIAGYLYANVSSGSSAAQPQPPSVAVSTASLDSETLFAQIWNLYQRKDNKQSALKEWRKLTNEEKGKVFLHVPAYVQAHPDKRYRPMLATYLHQKRFLDEEIIPQDNGNTATTDTTEQQRLAAYAATIAGYK